MSQTKGVVRTVSDMRKALRRRETIWTFPTLADLNAWEAIDREVGRGAGEALTAQTFRRMEILLAERAGLKLYELAPKALPEFAELCRTALPPSEGKLGREQNGLDDTGVDRDGVGQGKVPRLSSSLKPSHKKAYRQRKYAQDRCPHLEPGQKGDRAAHKWLFEHGDEDEDRLASEETWLRYLRAARRELGENNPRRGRDHGSSIVDIDQI